MNLILKVLRQELNLSLRDVDIIFLGEDNTIDNNVHVYSRPAPRYDYARLCILSLDGTILTMMFQQKITKFDLNRSESIEQIENKLKEIHNRQKANFSLSNQIK